jgi:hypothetical protein
MPESDLGGNGLSTMSRRLPGEYNPGDTQQQANKLGCNYLKVVVARSHHWYSGPCALRQTPTKDDTASCLMVFKAHHERAR